MVCLNNSSGDNLVMAQISNSKRLAKNSVYMYIRMIIVLLIALFSSRLLLKNLGVDDYGTYNLVGSIISMVAGLKGMFASATQRFLNYEMGRKNNQRLRLIFSMSIIINLVLSLIFVIVVEAIGLWFFEYKINIDPSRVFAAKYVFHLAVVSSVITIMTSPYDAVIIANEKFNFYAFSSILDAVLRLLAVILIPFLKGDHLIIYGCLLLFIAVIIRIINGFYCSKNFEESHFKKCWDKSTFSQMFSFAGWQSLGMTASTLRANGINMIFNVFGGTVVNAARGIAVQVESAVLMFLNNIITAITPYSIKAYAEGDERKVQQMFFFSSKILFIVGFIISVPIIYITHPILKLWLGVVPEYTVGFVQIIVVWSLVRSVHQPIDTLFKAAGRIREYQILEGVLLLLPLPLSYFALKNGYSMYVAFSTIVIVDIIDLASILLLSRKIIDVDLYRYFKEIVLPMILAYIVMAIGYYIVYSCFGGDFMTGIIASIIVDLLLSAFFYFAVFLQTEKNILKSLL